MVHLQIARVPLVVVATALSLAACGGGGPSFSRGTVRIGAATFAVRVADTEPAREAGLMHRPSLPSDQGMVFLMGGPTDRGFWMKDTLIPLTVAFWGRDGRIVAMLDMTPCRRDPCPVYRPGHIYVAALEVNRGALRDRGVAVGDRVRLVEQG